MNGSSSNPSDYEFLLRTLTEGNAVAKAESLKRFNTLVLSDKKQFASYAKRVVVGLGELMREQRDVNLLAATLALEVINLNPRDIEFYLRSKLLRPMVANLGDGKPQIRKTSHYCLLAFVRTFKNFDDLLEVYLKEGLASHEWQLRQKSINSLQSIIVMEMRHLNWESKMFRQTFEHLLGKLKDENGFVQKAAEQCLLSLSKVEELRHFSKKLTPALFTQLRLFCEEQYELGHLNEVKLDIAPNKQQPDRNFLEMSPKAVPSAVLLQNSDKADRTRAEGRSQSRVAPLRVHNGTSQDSPRRRNIRDYRQERERSVERGSAMRKAESVVGVNTVKDQLQFSMNLKEVRNPERDSKLMGRGDSSLLLPPIAMQGPTRQEKMEAIVGKKAIEGIRNDRDWKVRLEAIEQMQSKFQLNREDFDQEVLMKTFLPLLIKLLGDMNFKVAMTSLKLIEEILRTPGLVIDHVVPQIVDKLGDNKVALRQNISKLIKKEYLSSQKAVWIDNLLAQVKKSANANVKEEILNILFKLYDEGNLPYPYDKIIEVICPFMDDLKTKIKIKTLDLLAMITRRCGKVDRCKAMLSNKLNQVYYEMYLEKIGKELKSQREAAERQTGKEDKQMRSSVSHTNRKMQKVGTTTSTSLNRYGSHRQHPSNNDTVKTAFYQAPQKAESVHSRTDTEPEQGRMSEVSHMGNTALTDDSAKGRRKVEPRYLRRRTNKSIESRLSTTNYSTNGDGYMKPFQDPQKELKNIMTELKSEDWQVSNEAINKLRRMLMNHPQLLTQAVTKAIVPDIMRLTESLRSTLSKNGVVMINQMYAQLKRQLDCDLDLIFSKLIKKTLDTNSFISEEVKKALLSVCSNGSDTKVVNLLNNTHISRAIPVKTAIVNILEGITFLPKFYERDLEKITLILVDFMSEGSLQIRERTKNLLNELIISEKGDYVLKFIPKEHRGKLRKRKEPISPSKIEPSPEQTVTNMKQTAKEGGSLSELYPRRKKKQKISNFPSEFEAVEGHLQSCESSDWRIRLEHMTLLSEICLQYPQQTMQYRSSSRVIDVLSKQINDPNSKVAANALKAFISLVNRLPSLVEGSLSMILNEIFICFSSMKADVRQLAEDLFDEVCGTVEKWMLTQHLCNGAIYSIQKSKPTILGKLTRLVPTICKMKPNIFQKNVYPMINKLAQENKPQIVPVLKELLEAVYTEVGEDCMSFLKQKAKNLIFE